ncbi:MAG: chromate transporter [Gemmatimonadota bacterium]
MDHRPIPAAEGPAHLGELAALFFRLGATSFGGPAAHIALMEDAIVARRGWVSREEFLDLLGAANLIPGPNSSELAMHLGWRRAGGAGLVIAGIAFILPAAVITAMFAWIYVRLGTLPAMAGPLAGVRAAVLAVIAAAIWRLGKTAIKTRTLAVAAALVLAAALLGGNELMLLLGGGVIGACWIAGFPRVGRGASLKVVEPNLLGLGLYFLKIGSILYGSGYVLVAFLEGGLVERLGWLTRPQLVDAIAAGQFTPGPVLSTATFVGYLVLGWPGALVATLGIFLPSFLLVAATVRLVSRLRRSPWTSAFMDAVNVSALALMVAVALHLASTALGGPATWGIAAIALLVLTRWTVNPGWIVLGGLLVGALLP